MKKLFLLLLLCTYALSTLAKDPSDPWLVISKTDQKEVKFQSSVITLLDGVITVNSGQDTFTLEEVNSFYFDKDLAISGIDDSNNKVYVDAAANLTISGNYPLGNIAVYSLAGQLLKEVTTGDNNILIPLSTFAKGVYLIKVQGKTVKIIR
ncbi:MAG: T9SS type A sorting domain-containing protein [Dysgonamonadaceae bacterium]|jgi:hypothetical protein|nr:T9SS type A sorting domain-containing protein [Dysgonamonadaceae bacterium]